MRHARRNRAFFARMERELSIADSATELARENPDPLLLVGMVVEGDLSARLHGVLGLQHQIPGPAG